MCLCLFVYLSIFCVHIICIHVYTYVCMCHVYVLVREHVHTGLSQSLGAINVPAMSMGQNLYYQPLDEPPPATQNQDLEPLPGFFGHELCWGSTWFSQLSRRPTPTWVSKFGVKQIGRLMSSTRFYKPQDIDNMLDQWISGFWLTKFTSCRRLHLLLGQRGTLQRLSRCGTGSPWHPGPAGYAYPSWSPDSDSRFVVGWDSKSRPAKLISCCNTTACHPKGWSSYIWGKRWETMAVWASWILWLKPFLIFFWQPSNR